MSLTYRKLIEALQELTEEQLDMSVCVVDQDMESHDIDDTVLAGDLDLEDVLGENQPVLLIAGE